MSTTTLSATTLPGLLDAAASAWGDRPSVRFEDGESISFADFAARATARARELLGLGLDEGDKVGVFMSNSLDYLVTVWGAARLGAIPIPINDKFQATELRHVITHGDVRVLVTSDDASQGACYADLVVAAVPSLEDAADPAELSLPDVPALRQVVLLGGGPRPGFLSREQLERGRGRVTEEAVSERQARVGERDTAMILFTSGTTATPKGCMLNHRGILGNARLSAQTRFMLTEKDRFWNPLPFFHISTILPLSACLVAGSMFLAMRRFEPGVALAQMERERCTFAYPCFEAVAASLFNHPDFDTTDLSTVTRTVNVGLPERLRAMQARMPGATQLSSYGMTELHGILTYNSPDDPYEKRIYAVGQPFDGMEVRIIDPETGREQPPNVRGEMLYRGFARFDGYYRDPEATAAVIDADGWMHSGDVCSMDEEGFVSYHGRLKDMLKVGGENVAAAEVEGVLAEHPAVKVVQVVGAPDARYDEVVAAFVERQAGTNVDADTLIEFCVGRLAKFKIPRYVRFVDEWPLSGTKVQKHRLRAAIADELAASGITEAPRLAALSKRD